MKITLKNGNVIYCNAIERINENMVLSKIIGNEKTMTIKCNEIESIMYI